MANNPPEYDDLQWQYQFREWSSSHFPEAGRRQSSSLAHNQMSERADRCVVELGDPNNHTRFHGLPDRLAVNFHLDGGSLTPNLRISLKDLRRNRQVLCEMVFRSFSHTFPPAPNPSVDRNNAGNIDEFDNQPFQFSDRLYNLYAVIRPQDVFDSKLIEILRPGNFRILNITWQYQDVVVFKPAGPVHPDPEVQQMVHNARQCVRYSSISIWCKAIAPMIMGLKFFLSQPIPPPPAFYLYAKNVGRSPLESAVVSGLPGDPEIAHPGNEIEALMRRRSLGWTNLGQGNQGWEKHEAWPLSVPMYYVDERHCEAWQHSTMMREHQYEKYVAPKNPKFGNCNGRYKFNLDFTNTRNFMASQAFTVSIKPRNILDTESAPNEIILPVEGTHVSIDAERPLPDKKVENVQFQAQVLTLDRTRGRESINMLIIWAPNSGRVTGSYDDPDDPVWKGEFQFGEWGSQYTRTRAAIRFLLYGHERIRNDTWLKEIFLGRRTLRPLTALARYNQAVYDTLRQLLDLNLGQAHAFRAAVIVDMSPELSIGRLTLIQGPPGTGKTEVVVAFILYCLKINKQVLVVAGSNAALNVIAKRLERGLKKAGMSLEDIFHLKAPGAEQMSRDHQMQDINYTNAVGNEPADVQEQDLLVPAGQQAAPFLPTSLSPASQDRLDAYLTQQVSAEDTPFSLAHHVLKRKRVIGRHPRTDGRSTRANEEIEKMRAFVAADNAQHTLPLQDAPAPQPLTGDDSFDAKYLELQKFYLSGCRACLVTADSAGQRALIWMKAIFLVADEASQLKDHQLINASARHLRFGRLSKAAWVGDPDSQLPPNSKGREANEFNQLTERSTMEWRIQLGDPYHMLTRQYRSHPQISGFVSREFYQGRLVDDQSVFNRPFDAIWERFAQETFGLTTHNMFINVGGDHQLYQLRDDPSCVNPDTIAEVVRLLGRMNQHDAIDIYEDVMVISFYKSQVALLSSIVASRLPDRRGRSLDIRTVDGAIGDEKNIVILDFVRPGPRIGFLTERRRLCVAFSRAKHAVIGVGTTQIGRSSNDHGRPTVGAQILGRYIRQHEQNGTCIRDQGDVEDIRRDFVTSAAGYRVFHSDDEEH